MQSHHMSAQSYCNDEYGWIGLFLGLHYMYICIYVLCSLLVEHPVCHEPISVLTNVSIYLSLYIYLIYI